MSKFNYSFLHDLFLKHAHEVSDFIRVRWPMEQHDAGIVQELFLCLSSQYAGLEAIHTQQAVLLTIASTIVVDRKRHRKIRKHYTEDLGIAANIAHFDETSENLHHDSSAQESSPLPKDVVNRIFLDSSSQLHRFLAYRVQCTETAEDLAQEVYLRLPQMQSTVVSEVGVRAWLFRVASNLSIDYLRSQRRHAELLSQFCGNETEIDKASSLYQATLDRDRLKQVQNALEKLPDQCAEVLYLSRIEGCSHAKIARQLGISKSLVEKHVARALNHCRKVINENGE